jgi:hypothetical protein
MNAGQWFDLVLTLCRIMILYQENKKARRQDNGGQ